MALLCTAGAGLVLTEAAPAAHHPIPAWSAMVRPATPPVAARTTNDRSPGDPVTTNAATPDDQARTAATVKQAMHEVLPDAEVGFEVFDRQAGIMVTNQNAGQRFASMSVVKLLIALDAMASHNWATPDDATQQELGQMLADSDDEIADELWAGGGGPAIVTRMVSLLGLTGTQPPGDPGEWGDTLITPQDIVTVYRYITGQLSTPERNLVLDALGRAPQIAADGFDQYFGIPDGMPHITWAIKQGWGTSGSQAVMNSTGLVGTDMRYVVVVLAAASANSYSTVPAVVTAGAGAIAGIIGAMVP
jgi:hypothetical protein